MNELRPKTIQSMSADKFLELVRAGQCEFTKIRITEDVDFGVITLDKLRLTSVTFDGEVTGTLTIREIYICSASCVYFCNVFPALLYTGSLIKDLTS